MAEDRCEYPRCREVVDIVYLNHDVCEKHWQMHCAGKIDLKKVFGIDTHR